MEPDMVYFILWIALLKPSTYLEAVPVAGMPEEWTVVERVTLVPREP